MKKYLKLVTVCILVLGLALMVGCGQKATTEAEKPAGEPEKQATTEAPKEVTTYKVGTDAAYAPFESVDPSNTIVGFDMDMLNAIAAAEGFKVEFVNTAWEGIIPSLVEKRNDMLISAMTINEERKKEVAFSDQYYESTNYIAVLADSPIKSLADLKGKKVSVQQGTTGDFAITKALGKDYNGIKRFKGTPEALLELKNGKVDAGVADSGVIMEYVKNNTDLNLKIVKDDKFAKEYYGIAIRKDDTELLNKVNSGLKKIKENGEYDKVFEKYFGKVK